MTFSLESPAFRDGERIPDRYTCDGEDISPPLRWTDLPAGAKSLVLIVEDPDVPFGFTVTHWILYNISSIRTELPEGAPKEKSWEGMGQGRRMGGRYGYMGPCPPGKKVHRYYFRLYALNQDLSLSPGATRSEVLKAMSGHIIASAELMGRYGYPRSKRKR